MSFFKFNVARFSAKNEKLLTDQSSARRAMIISDTYIKRNYPSILRYAAQWKRKGLRGGSRKVTSLEPASPNLNHTIITNEMPWEWTSLMRAIKPPVFFSRHILFLTFPISVVLLPRSLGWKERSHENRFSLSRHTGKGSQHPQHLLEARVSTSRRQLPACFCLSLPGQVFPDPLFIKNRGKLGKTAMEQSFPGLSAEYCRHRVTFEI